MGWTEARMVLEDGFEGPFVYYEGVSELEVPEGWVPLWVQGETPGVNHRPEYKPEAERARSGKRAAKLFTTHASHDAVLARRVEVEPGLLVRLEAWGATYRLKAGQALRVGIDPTGAVQFPSERMVWGEWWGQYNADWEGEAYHRFVVEALAERSTVTVFLHSRSDYAAATVAAYWDDARLTQEGAEPGPDEGLRRVFDEFLADLAEVVQQTREKL